MQAAFSPTALYVKKNQNTNFTLKISETPQNTKDIQTDDCDFELIIENVFYI